MERKEELKTQTWLEYRKRSSVCNPIFIFCIIKDTFVPSTVSMDTTSDPLQPSSRAPAQLSKHKCTMGLRPMPMQPILTPVHGYHLSSHHLSTFLLRLSFSFINIMDSYGNIYPLTNPLVLITSCFAVVSSLYLMMRYVSSHSTPPIVIRLDGSLLS